jgi:putative tryptophan/tyrosine transport system substrate-binding protein
MGSQADCFVLSHSPPRRKVLSFRHCTRRGPYGGRMRRREFIRLISGSTALLSLMAHAQQPDRKRRIGVLMGIADNDPEARPRVEAFERGLQELGWAEGQNIHLDYRWTAGDPDRTLLFAKEIFDLKPDVILVHSSPAVAALRQLTSKIPLVFVLIADPIGSGFVASLAHPGGNVTGFMNAEATMAGKWLGLIKEIAPKIEQVALIYNPRTSPYHSYLREFDATAGQFKIRAVPMPVLDAAELEHALHALGQEPNSAFFVVPDVFVQVHRALIIKLAEEYRLPAIYPYRFFPTSGGLLSYGFDTVIVFRQAASYVDKIMKGVVPADLPVQAPSIFKMVVNLKAARAIGLTIPESFLVNADEVID